MLLMANWVIFFAVIIFILLGRNKLPPELQSYLSAQRAVNVSNIDLIFDLIYLVLTMAAWIGLYRFKAWSRELFIASFIIGLAGLPMRPIYIHTGWMQLIGSLSSILGGMLIAVVYYSPMAKAFRSEANV